MDYNSPLLEGRFIKRYKRFFADVELDGQIVVAHVPNTGSLKGICDSERPCRLQNSSNPERKLKYTLEQVQTPTSWVGVNTHRANEIVFEAFCKKQIPHWANYLDIQREVKINPATRIDFKLSGPTQHFVEVKSVTLAKDNLAQFPDAVTTRGQKHLEELMHLQSQGATTEIFFLIQREDCSQFQPASDIDPEYARLLQKAQKAGVRLTALSTKISAQNIKVNSTQSISISLK